MLVRSPARCGDARPNDGDRRAGDLDDRVVRRGCVDDVGGRHGVDRCAHDDDKQRCNNTARDHTPGRERTARHTPARGKSVAGRGHRCLVPSSRGLLEPWTKAADNGTIADNVFSACVPDAVSRPKLNPGCVNNRGYLFCGTGGQKGMRRDGVAPAAMRMRLRRCYCRFAFPRGAWNTTAVNFSTFSNARLHFSSERATDDRRKALSS